MDESKATPLIIVFWQLRLDKPPFVFHNRVYDALCRLNVKNISENLFINGSLYIIEYIKLSSCNKFILISF